MYFSSLAEQLSPPFRGRTLTEGKFCPEPVSFPGCKYFLWEFIPEGHLSLQKACIFGAIRLHKVESNDKEEMTGPALAKAIASDVKKGLIPFYVRHSCSIHKATLGTTATCAFDDLKQIGTVCEKAGIWLHIDAAYARASFICPEFRPLLDGVEREHRGNTEHEPEQTPLSSQDDFANWAAPTVAVECIVGYAMWAVDADALTQETTEFADSFNFNPHKWLLTSFDCSALCVKEIMFSHKHEDDATDFRHWEIPLGRKFRSLKLWFVLRLYGVKGLQAYIRKHVELAHEFEKLVTADDRFQVTLSVTHGLVCFKLRQGSNELNELFLANLTKDGRVHLTASINKGNYFLRFIFCARNTESSDIQYSWNVIREVATATLENTKSRAK
ncbi:Aromatic-L-amino-acid decarboxylase [Lamellibrachia satsuma]|nr:Aromatic-L-amino-acid decarboxylase [Lamellibrachia satsuma]